MPPTNIVQNIQDSLTELPTSLQVEVFHYIEFLKSNYVINDAEDKTSKPHKYRQAGILEGKIWMSEDFDEPLKELEEYM